MVKVDGNGAEQLLNLLEKILESSQVPSQDVIDEILSTKGISSMIEAYSNMLDFSKEEFINVLKNLANPTPIAKGIIVSKLEEGLRSCLDREKINLLRRRLQQFLKFDFAEAEWVALKYLPPETPVECTIYFTIDAFNPGMISGDNMFLSILTIDPSKFDLRAVSHEFHHIGFKYWIRQNQKLSRLAFEKTKTYEGIAVNLILSLISEGLANYFCSPNMVRIHPKISPKGKEKLMKYEQDFTKMLKTIISLISNCQSKTIAIEECIDRFNQIIIDPESILPPIHFVGAKLIELFDKNPSVDQVDIINLCKHPANFFKLYSIVISAYELPSVPDTLAQWMIDLLGN